MPSIRGLLRSGESGSGEPIADHSIGHAHVLSRGEPSSGLQALAMSLAADPDNDLVLLDLQDELPVAAWESVASAVPRSRRRGIRLLVHGGERGAPTMIGQWLAQRLGRTVIAPDGELVRGPGGALFVYSKPDSGWMRLRPGRVPTWDSKRYPVPAWDPAASEYWTSSSTAGIEPMPSGVWIHDMRAPEVIARNRGLLSANVPCQPEVLTVLLGCPGTAPVSLDDAARFWHGLTEPDRARVRFVQYGEVQRPDGETFGQALADFLGAAIVCYTGIPIGRPTMFEIRTVASNARPGWRPFVLELGYQPRNGSAVGPALLTTRIPLPRAEEVSPRVYWYAPDAVIEIVQSGLWVRPPAEPTNAAQVRSVPLDPDVAALIFDDAVAARAARMRVLAEDLAGQLDRSVAPASVLCAASALADRRALPAAVAAALGPSSGLGVAPLALAEPATATLPARVPPAPAEGTLSSNAPTDEPVPPATGHGAPGAPPVPPPVAPGAPLAPPPVDPGAPSAPPPVEPGAVPEQPRPSAGELGWAPPEWWPPGPIEGAALDHTDPASGVLEPAGGPAAEAVGPSAGALDGTGPAGSEPGSRPELGRPQESMAPPPDPDLVPSLGRPPSPNLGPQLPVGDLVVVPELGAAPTGTDPEPADGTGTRTNPEPVGTGMRGADRETTRGANREPVGTGAGGESEEPAGTGAPGAGQDPTTAGTGSTSTDRQAARRDPEASGAEPGEAVARPQPVPVAKASALIPRRGLDTERAWLRRSLSRDFDTLASSVARIMSEHPGMKGGSDANPDDVLADSVAVRLYLSGRGLGIDAGLRSGRGGPHVPFARCTAAGLNRLPSFRGTAVVRASLTDSEWAFYRDRRLVTDWSFVNMLSGPCSAQRGDTDVLVWSMTARRTALLEPDGDEHVDDRVVFLPGTNFKVLGVEEGTAERRGAVLLREIGGNEIDDDGNVDRNRVSLDELAVKSMRRSLERWADAEHPQRTGAAAVARFGALPGLAGPVREREVAQP